MSKFKRKAFLLMCILSIQMMKSAVPLHANPMILTYDGQQHTYNKPPITLHINDKNIEMPIMPPVQIDGRTLVPTREVFEPLGASVEWKTAEKKVFINHGDTLMIMEVDKKDVWIDGKIEQLDVPAKIINNKLMLPLRFIGETLGYEVDWEHETSNINIKQNKPEPKPELPNETSKPNTDLDVETGLVSVLNVETENISDMISSYTINFEKPIDSYNKFEEKGKIVIDIDNAKNLLSSNITMPKNPYVKTIRTSQFKPNQTRVVFDLKAGATNNVELSKDGMSIRVQVAPLIIDKPHIGINTVGPFLSLPNMAGSQIEILALDNPERIIIDLPMTTINDMQSLKNIEGEVVSEVKTGVDNTGTRIILNLNSMATYELIDNKNDVMIQLTKPIEKSTRNLKYISAPREVFMFKKAPGLSRDSIKIKDDYRNKVITVTLPGNYEDLYDNGIFEIGSKTLDKVTVRSNGQTEFIINEKQILAFDLIDDGEYIQIVFMAPKEKYEKIVVLDMGHGAHDNGTSGNGLIEKTLNLQQGMVTYDLLEKNPDIKVYVTREDDSYPTNPFRAQMANEIASDMFVSMHNNSFTTSKANGTEVLYSTSSPKSKQMAEIMQKNMVRELGTFDRKAKARPDLIVLNSTKMPAILVETAFVSNEEDAKKLKSPEFNNKVGRVVYESIIEIFNTLSFR